MDTKVTISMSNLIDKQFIVTMPNDKKIFQCRLCGTLCRSVAGVGKHWRQKHQSHVNIRLD